MRVETQPDLCIMTCEEFSLITYYQHYSRENWYDMACGSWGTVLEQFSHRGGFRANPRNPVCEYLFRLRYQQTSITFTGQITIERPIFCYLVQRIE